MVAHLDSVTSLAVDQHGLYLISGSHDCSIRWLALDKKRIIVNFGKDPLVLIALTQAVESWKQDLRAGDNRSQEEVWRKHFRRRFPPFETIHCQVLSFQQKPFHLDPIFLQRWRRCSCESVHLNSWIQDSQDLPLKTIKTSIMTLYIDLNHLPLDSASCVSRDADDLYWPPPSHELHLLKQIPYTLNVKFMW